jgi:hypothetical protein
MSLHDTDKPLTSPLDQSTPLVRSTIEFNHPAGFTVGTCLVIAIDPKGPCFINMPPDPALVLHLLKELTVYILQNSIRVIEGGKPKSNLVVVPGGSLPPWDGPAGRG